MGLAPLPEELQRIEWGRPYGLLPSRFTSEDYYWLSLAERVEAIRRLNEMWEGPQRKRLMKDAVTYIIEMRKKAKRLVEELGLGNDTKP